MSGVHAVRALSSILLLTSSMAAGVSLAAEPKPSLAAIPPDLTTPPMTDEAPGPGKRVKQVHPEFRDTQIHHALYLPTDWVPGRKWPVLVEYAGNQYQATSPGTIDGSNLGYGLSAGKGLIWICMPYVDPVQKINVRRWWGDVQATVDYCKLTVDRVGQQYGGVRPRVFLAGFSRGAIGCNFLGLHDDQIAGLWRGFICHSHYDGVRKWPYPDSDRASATARLARLKDRPQFISHEISVDETRQFLQAACPNGHFTFVPLAYPEHTDAWVLRNVPEREKLRAWFREALR
jgi:hypothetical protein